MRKKIFFLILTILIVFLGIYFIKLYTPGINENNSSVWKEIGKGNLKAVDENGTWKLYPVGARYIDMLGIEGEEYKLLSQDVYEQDILSFKKIPSSIITIETINGNKSKIVKTDTELYDTKYEPNKRMVRTKDNDLIISEYDNLWLIDHNSEKAKSFLDLTGYEETSKILYNLNQNRDNKIFLNWGSNAFVTEDQEKIIFHSNRDSVINGNSFNSIYSVDTEGNNIKLLLDAEKYNQNIEVIGCANNLVVAYLNDNDSLVTYNLTDDEGKEIKLNGYPDSLSPDGNYLLYRKIVDDVIQREFYVLNLTDGSEEFIGMPDDYFYNSNGAWSPDSKKYAFYLNGYSNNDTNKGYRTNVKIGIVDIESKQINTYDNPSDKNYLYTLGSISWLGNNQVICYTDDNTTWSLTIEKE